MRRRSVVLIFLIVSLPMALLTWAGMRMAADEQAVVEQRFETLLEGRLKDINRTIERHLAETERKLQRLTQTDDLRPESLRMRQQGEPAVMQFFVLNSDGELVYPDPSGSLNQTERSFLARTHRMFSGKDLFTEILRQEERKGNPFTPGASNLNTTPSGGRSIQARQQDAMAPENSPFSIPGTSGWFVWYWDGGMNLIYWHRRPSGQIVGAALERARWISDLIAVLPDTQQSASSEVAADLLTPQIQLLDADSEIIYQWGGSKVPESQSASGASVIEELPVSEIPVAAPLAAWRLQCLMPADERTAFFASRSVYAGLIGGLIAAGAALTGLALLLYRDYSRDMREAAQQVSFVNQVSHELKTPLTNIRLYAELLEHDLESADSAIEQKAKNRLNVITQEAQRLSRLISNVLTLARQQRRSLQAACRNTDIRALTADIVHRFEPSLKANGIRVELESINVEHCFVDPDFVEQILGNLISNVEKYAASGGYLKIINSCDESRPNELRIDVIDHGPGIGAARQSDLFKPFSRLSHHIHHSSGTGIGLSIARQLARIHGGDLQLIPSAQGCTFRITLPQM
ncbi:MAG: HAMP domain-containing histidine kinase [Planctomyces sp.]|nr:HAMP domain-containing histidine kinase [Planctomyces sp.]